MLIRLLFIKSSINFLLLYLFLSLSNRVSWCNQPSLKSLTLLSQPLKCHHAQHSFLFSRVSWVSASVDVSTQSGHSSCFQVKHKRLFIIWICLLYRLVCHLVLFFSFQIIDKVLSWYFAEDGKKPWRLVRIWNYIPQDSVTGLSSCYMVHSVRALFFKTRF